MIKKTPTSIASIGALLMAALPAISLATAPDIAGTRWQLMAIQSMDDAQGTTRIHDPSQYTLEFGRDGEAAFRLDCNRGTASYLLKPSADRTNGSIQFGPIAATHAMCPPPHLSEKVARDMTHVRGYLLKESRLYLSLMADGGIYEWAPLHATDASQNATQNAGQNASENARENARERSTDGTTDGTTDDASKDRPRKVKPVRFAKGRSEATLRDRIVGRQTIDYTVRASAGQRLRVSLKSSHAANSFNVLPPGSSGAAMAIGDLLGNQFEGLLPDDGVYTVRVFLVRSAARRNEASDFTLGISVTGSALKPVSPKVDAVLPGTRYHAKTSVACEPANSKARECEAYVVRRGADGTATVELRWDSTSTRRILFIGGEPKAADSAQAMSFVRNERGWRVTFDGQEHFEIPEGLVFGG
jgi:heat shock protein HslJ